MSCPKGYKETVFPDGFKACVFDIPDEIRLPVLCVYKGSAEEAFCKKYGINYQYYKYLEANEAL